MHYGIFMLSFLWATASMAENYQHDIPISTQGARTFYVQSDIQGSGASMMLIDTGSAHSVINAATLAKVQASGDAEFVKNLQAVMADGSTRIVPLYQLSAITLGGHCVIRNIKAAVLPHQGRQILGISTLQKAAPFGFSFDPPTLSLSRCAELTNTINSPSLPVTEIKTPLIPPAQDTEVAG